MTLSPRSYSEIRSTVQTAKCYDTSNLHCPYQCCSPRKGHFRAINMIALFYVHGCTVSRQCRSTLPGFAGRQFSTACEVRERRCGCFRRTHRQPLSTLPGFAGRQFSTAWEVRERRRRLPDLPERLNRLCHRRHYTVHLLRLYLKR